MTTKNALIIEIAQTIAEANDLRNFDISNLNPEARLVDPPFNLDSLGILEAVASIEDKYKVRIANARDGEVHFKSLQTIADFVNSKN